MASSHVPITPIPPNFSLHPYRNSYLSLASLCFLQYSCVSPSCFSRFMTASLKYRLVIYSSLHGLLICIPIGLLCSLEAVSVFSCSCSFLRLVLRITEVFFNFYIQLGDCNGHVNLRAYIGVFVVFQWRETSSDIQPTLLDLSNNRYSFYKYLTRSSLSWRQCFWCEVFWKDGKARPFDCEGYPPYLYHLTAR